MAVNGLEGGFCSLGILNNKEIKILHSSTRLISATCNPVDEKEQLTEFGWYANLVSQGSSDETEYKISRKIFDANVLKLSVGFIQIKAKQKYAFAPEGLNDGSLNPEFISGGIVIKIYFDPSKWFVVNDK